ncbi:unnamed protein product, partial [Ixodes pacificus]
MPGKVRVKLLAARNLPVMDRASEACDAFGEVRAETGRRGLLLYASYSWDCRCSVSPTVSWWSVSLLLFQMTGGTFQVDDEELQDEPLQIRIMDYDTYSANDAIGKVYIDLNPLLVKEVGSTLSGWLPIYDTMHGKKTSRRAELTTLVYSTNSFFSSTGVPLGHYAQAILGFVEELVVNDDPEYKWIDKIRTPRASNEARQTLFSKLS